MTTHSGGCHCGKVAFEVEAPDDLHVTRCNCSICSMTGFLHLIVPRTDFRLLRGEGDLTTYTFNTGVARHTFCRHCGVKSFYTPRSHPQGVSVNVNCLDRSTVRSLDIEDFDGHNWEQNIAELSPISD
ncbi:MAG: GFA family protein [Woeseiaceae bacterium]|nr:GFA family protein [Woeseiaceae bacterium]